MEERRIIDEESHEDRPGRSRGPILGLIIVMVLVLVVLIVFLVNGDSDDDGGGVSPEDIEVDIGEDG